MQLASLVRVLALAWWNFFHRAIDLFCPSSPGSLPSRHPFLGFFACGTFSTSDLPAFALDAEYQMGRLLKESKRNKGVASGRPGPGRGKKKPSPLWAPGLPTPPPWKNSERRTRAHDTGGGSKGARRVPLPNAPPTLEELGITKKESSAAQKLLMLPKRIYQKVRGSSLTRAAAWSRALPCSRCGIVATTGCKSGTAWRLHKQWRDTA